jgi:nucleotide-binding universal stress UspA family protein
MSGPIERILVYIDGTEESLTAAQYAILLSKATGAKLYGTFIVNTHALNDLLKSHIFVESEQMEYQRDLEQDAGKYLHHFETMAASKGVAAETLRENGSVHVKLKEMVREYEIDLLVVGELSRIRSRRDEFLNESERALRTVPCSVLVVKDTDRVWELFENDSRG